MEKVFYFPFTKISELAAWFANFILILKPVYKDYDVTDEEMTALESDNAFVQFTSNRMVAYGDKHALFIRSRNIVWTGDPDNENLEIVQPEGQVAEIPKEDIPAGIRPNLRPRIKSLVLRLRQHPKMTEAKALQMGIMPNPKATADPKGYVPTLTSSLVDGKAVLECPIKGFAGYEIWRDTSGKNEFIKFGISVGRSFTDETPMAEGVQAEVRNYKVRMLDSSNKTVGAYSVAISVTVTRAI